MNRDGSIEARVDFVKRLLLPSSFLLAADTSRAAYTCNTCVVQIWSYIVRKREKEGERAEIIYVKGQHI